MLRKKTNGAAGAPHLTQALHGLTGHSVDRRTFLRRSGLTAGGVAAAGVLTGGMVTKANAQTAAAGVEIKKSVCTHCSVGCSVMAEVSDGVWVGQEPVLSPARSTSGHALRQRCAAIRELVSIAIAASSTR